MLPDYWLQKKRNNWFSQPVKDKEENDNDHFGSDGEI